MDLKIAGKVALVCGASKGFGRAIATQLAAEGCRVALCARTREEPLEQTACEIAEQRSKPRPIAAHPKYVPIVARRRRYRTDWRLCATSFRAAARQMGIASILS